VHHSLAVDDRALARVVRRCHDLAGQELFQWMDAQGERHRVDSSDVNDYLREISGQVLDCVRSIAGRLGNTPAVCRKCYIHPVVLAAHIEGKLPAADGRAPLAVLRALLRGAASQHRPARSRQHAPTTSYALNAAVRAARSDARLGGTA
jgi:DNA topoisomerase IB